MEILQLPKYITIIFIIYFGYIKLSYKKIRLLLLCILSFGIMFYTKVNVISIVILYTTVIINYGMTFLISYYDKIKEKKIVLGIIVCIDIGLLFVFKDFNFFLEILRTKSYFTGYYYAINNIDVLVPFGISIYTLVLIGYVIDVYNKKIPLERNPIKLFLVAGFYPILFYGPIIRFSEIKDNFCENKKYSYDDFYHGVQRIILGVFKKFLIADKLGIIVDTIYNDTIAYSGSYLWIATGLFVIQFYAEFSGYIDIVLGFSRLFGIDLPENFECPFSAKSVEEFWKRWNITLNIWANDYILDPIINKKQSLKNKKYIFYIKKYAGMFLMWFFIGLWYGDTWNYVFGFGIFIWILIVLSDLLNPLYISIIKGLKLNTEHYIYIKFQQIRTFFIITLCFFFFRSQEGLLSGFQILKNALIDFQPNIVVDVSLMKLGLDEKEIHGLGISLLIFIVSEYLYNKNNKINTILQSAIMFNIIYTLFYDLFQEQIGEQGTFYLIVLSIIFALYSIVYYFRKKYIISLFVFLLGTPICFIAFEMLSQNWFLMKMEVNLKNILFNFPFYYTIFFLMEILFRKKRTACIISTMLIGVLGLINHYIVRFRGTAISPYDIRSWKIGMGLLDNYELTVNEFIVISMLFLIAYMMLVSIISVYSIENSRKEKNIYRIVTLILVGNIIILYNTDILKKNNIFVGWDGPLYNGSVLNFFVEFKESKIAKPDGYSDEIVADILENITDTFVDKTYTKPVHVIAIMNETFSDFSEWNDLKLSEDTTPFFHSLSKNTVKGKLFVPVFGGGTANTEFEFLTNHSMACLPVGAVPYYVYMKNNMPSLVSQMNNQNYMTVGYHAERGRNYNRDLVYEDLGFDKVILGYDDKEGFVYEKLRWCESDQSDFNNLKRLSEKAGNSPLFVFNVTIQNHGGYFMNWPDLQETIHLTGNLQGKFPDAKQYFSLIRETDKALENLIEYYSKSDIPTMIIFFGDHKPVLDNAYYEKINGSELNTVEEQFKQYTTPFFIWANYDIPEQEDVNISSWGLSILAMKMAGVQLTPYQEYLYSLIQRLPVITPLGFITNSGEIIPKDQISEYKEYYELYKQYNYLVYNVLFDKNRNDEYFFLKRK